MARGGKRPSATKRERIRAAMLDEAHAKRHANRTLACNACDVARGLRAQGFPATEMAKKVTRRDFRNPDRIREWAGEVARALPYARPHVAVEPPGRGWPRLISYGVLGWALCGALMMLLLRALPENAALAIHAIAAPLVFLALTRRYARVRGPREPWVVATTWTALIALLDAGLAGLVLHDFAMFRSVLGTWLPFTLVFFVTWLTGFLMSTLPWPKSNKTPPDASLSSAH